MSKSELLPVVEAIIFASGASVPIARIATALEADKADIEDAVDLLIKEYDKKSHGIEIVRLNDSVQMISKKQYGEEIRNVMDLKRNTPLSNAAFEVLAVVAYNQPVTKAFVEQVRGVDCSGVIGSLCQKDLIEEKGRLELPGRPLIYGTTENFLRCFSISSPDELPRPKPVEEEKALDGENADTDNKDDADNSEKADGLQTAK